MHLCFTLSTSIKNGYSVRSALNVLEGDDDLRIALTEGLGSPVVTLELILEDRLESIQVPIDNDIPFIEGNTTIAGHPEIIHQGHYNLS